MWRARFTWEYESWENNDCSEHLEEITACSRQSSLMIETRYSAPFALKALIPTRIAAMAYKHRWYV